MKLVNKTNLNNKSIIDLANFAEVNLDLVTSLTIVDVKDLRGPVGRVVDLDNGNYLILLVKDDDEYLETLAHEIKHIQHFISPGLTRDQEEEEAIAIENKLRNM